MEVSTKERLAKALEERKNPRLKRMIKQAREGFYDDFESPVATPCIMLVQDLTAYGETELAQRAMCGEFDATKEESERWRDSLDGMEAFDDPIAVELARNLFQKMTGVDPLNHESGGK